MQMIHCPNCAKLTGFKRSLGFGTFFVVLLTCGLWLLAIPLYPMRCITCGLTRGEAHLDNLGIGKRGAVTILFCGIAIVCLGLGVLNLFQRDAAPAAPMPTITALKNSVYQGNAVSDSERAAPVEKAINIDSLDLLSAFQADEEAAATRFADKKVIVVGVLTGVFTPSVETSMRVAGSGGNATAFVTMGGPRPMSVEETLFTPGITAYSEPSSYFGQQNRGRLLTGEIVTLACTCREYGSLDGKNYSLTLDGCTLMPLPKSEPDGSADSAQPSENINPHASSAPVAVTSNQSVNAPDEQRILPSGLTRGQTSAEVLGILGAPTSVTMGAQNIYSYPHLRVVFVDGKVSDIQRF